MDGPRKTEMKKNLREGANPLSALLFCWILPIFFRGYKRDLEVSDLTRPLKEHKSSNIGEKLTLAWEKELKRCGIKSLVGIDNQEKNEKSNEKRKMPSLTRAIMRVYGWHIAGYGLLLFFMEFFLRISQPQFLRGMIMYFAPDNVLIEKQDAFLYAGGVIMCSAISVLTAHRYGLGLTHIGMKLRVSCCSLIYRKFWALIRRFFKEKSEPSIDQFTRLFILYCFLYIRCI